MNNDVLEDTISDRAETEAIPSDAELAEPVENAVKNTEKQAAEQIPVVDVKERFVVKNPVIETANVKVAAGKNEAASTITQAEQVELDYRLEEYVPAEVEMTDLSTMDYVKKENLMQITEKLQQLIDAEAPITYDKLVKKTLRAFNISRSSTQTLEATDKALKKASSRMNKQSGVKFYWRRDQNPERYWRYRNDSSLADKRSGDEICQQELKNAVCVTLREKVALEKDSLVRETIRTMGYARSSAALIAAVERGLKYGRKTGEIVQDAENRFTLNENM